MAKAPRKARPPRPSASPATPVRPALRNTISPDRGEFTGRMLVVLEDNGVNEGLSALKSATGLSNVCRSSDFDGSEVDAAQADGADVVLLEQLKIAVVNVDPAQSQSLMTSISGGGSIVSMEPERMMYALADFPPLTGPQLQYLRGYRDAVNALYAALSSGSSAHLEQVGPTATFADTARHTWGLIATKVDRARVTGHDVRIAVLDTGLDLEHPDFAGRSITHASFIQGEAVQDGNRHGTHCIGTAMGSMQPSTGVRRYGCASGAHIFAGKVLSNAGSGADGGILAGINWAIANQCRIISMSLGSSTRPGDTFSTTYETVAQRALRSRPGTIIIAAAGNDSHIGPGQRREPPNPVGRPANCPSIMAVAALDSSLGVATFSNGGINPEGGGIDIAAPGVSVFSSLPVARGTHGLLSGTSMATPHVAGIAALWLEARGPDTSAQELWQVLTSTALRLNQLDRDVGAGLVQAPN